MGNIQHSNAKTTPRIRKEIQESNETIAELAARLSLNPKTVIKWKNAKRTTDKKSGPTTPKSTVLTEQEEQIICEFRRVTKFSLDDVFIALKDEIPKMTRSNLHRCLQRHGLSRLPKEDVAKKEKKSFKEYHIGYVHMDISEVHTQQGKACMFLAFFKYPLTVFVMSSSSLELDFKMIRSWYPSLNSINIFSLYEIQW